MGEASIGASRPGSSTVKNRDADKKRANLWKKQAKSFKLKDVGKKVDAVRFCAQDERFFREQTEVLPLLIGFLSRTKTPELVMETLTVLYTLLSPPTATEAADADPEVIHPDVNAIFILDRSLSTDSAWKAGEPFINLFGLNALAPDIRIKAIQVYDLLLRASVELSISTGAATPFPTVGSPCSALLGCLAVDNGDLQFTALSCLRSLLNNLDEEFLSKFEAEKGVSRCLEFVSHSERRYHRPALDILETFSKIDCGRELLKKNNVASILRNAIQEVQEMIQKTSTIVPLSGVDASPLSSSDAPLLCANIGIICQVFVRMTLAREQVDTSKPVEDNVQLFTDVVDAMIGILRYDIASGLTASVVPTETPRATGAAAAAANAALANAAALVALLPFSIERCIAVISSLGRIIENSEQCKAHAKSQGLLPVLLDCFKVKEARDLHQVADKLLHLCIHIMDTPDSNVIGGDGSGRTHLDAQVLCAVSTRGVEISGDDEVDQADYADKPPLVAVDTVLSLLETSCEAASSDLVFRHVRWLAALMELPGNAKILGERAVSLFLQILATTSSNDKLFFAFLAKCIHAIVLENSAAFELCGSGGNNPSLAFLEFLTQSSKSTEILETSDTDVFSTEENVDQTDEIKCFNALIDKAYKLEWIDEYKEEDAFKPKPLTETLHGIDVYLAVAEALAALTSAFLKWNSSGSTATDFSELMATVSPGKPEIPTSGGSKKKLPADQTRPSAMGEAVMLGLLEKGLQVPKLISQYTAVNPAVCVSLLGLLDNLMKVTSGMKVLLHLAKNELQSSTGEEVETSTKDEWPLSVECSSRMEHTLLLLPVLSVLQSPDTSFH
ncbi:hypothetical protein GN244_ATG10241 [Phytophthora infestans]|uniref:Uncharacterized protein n=1 Tax=Phytophthora infestans TaxID=4787 RepID=A0A833WCT0_PHYIN|nr:hypothetical protein GN244_ATG10241 [Phytophthora infestans]